MSDLFFADTVEEAFDYLLGRLTKAPANDVYQVCAPVCVGVGVYVCTCMIDVCVCSYVDVGVSCLCGRGCIYMPSSAFGVSWQPASSIDPT